MNSCNLKFKEGDWIYTPQWYSGAWKWTSSKCQIDYVAEDFGIKDNWKYWINGIRATEKEVFDNKEDCDKYIQFYYYNNSCDNCKYEDTSTNWDCHDCAYLVETNKNTKNTDKTHGDYHCGFLEEKYNLKIKVINKYKHPCSGIGEEICKFYKPTLSQNVRDYHGWEFNNEVLKNCDFNPNCNFHRDSAFKTCTYERYINKRMNVHLDFEYEGRKVDYIQISREQWINQSYIQGDNVICFSVGFKYERNKQGKIRKEDYPLFVVFNELTAVKFR